MINLQKNFGRMKNITKRAKKAKPAQPLSGVVYAGESQCGRLGYLNRASAPSGVYACFRCGLYHDDDAGEADA